MTKQEFMQSVFNKVVTHVVQQGRPAIKCDGEGVAYSCRYRLPLEDDTVLMCAVGCLIPDSAYSDTIEGVSVDAGDNMGPDPMLATLSAAFPDTPPEWLENDAPPRRLLRKLQKAHDETGLSCTTPEDFVTFVEEFKQRAKGIALMFNLTMPTFEGEKQ